MASIANGARNGPNPPRSRRLLPPLRFPTDESARRRLDSPIFFLSLQPPSPTTELPVLDWIFSHRLLRLRRILEFAQGLGEGRGQRNHNFVTALPGPIDKVTYGAAIALTTSKHDYIGSVIGAIVFARNT
jgi:hypothetical protein